MAKISKTVYRELSKDETAFNVKEYLENSSNMLDFNINQINSTKKVLSEFNSQQDIVEFLTTDSVDRNNLLYTISFFLDQKNGGLVKQGDSATLDIFLDIFEMDETHLNQLSTVYDLYSSMEFFNKNSIADFDELDGGRLENIVETYDSIVNDPNTHNMTESEFNLESKEEHKHIDVTDIEF